MKKNKAKVQTDNPEKCKGHVWRHLCEVTKAGNSTNKLCKKGGIAAGCNNLICVNCGGLDKDRREYQCFKCGKYFMVFRELDTDKPICNECFELLRKIDNPLDYQKFINQ